MMNLLHWRLLVAVADAGNISRAAEEIGMTQSGASQAIAQLEASLGFPVFTRERRYIGITALGEQVVEHARNMLSQLNAIRELEGSDEEVEAWLAADTVELGVVMNPVPGRAEVVLGQDAWVAVLPASHRLAQHAKADGITLKALADQPFVLATGGCVVNGKSLMEKAGLQLSDIRVTVRDWISACKLVGEEMGVALVPESALPETLRNLCVVPVTPAIHREFGLVCSPSGTSSDATQALLNALRKRR